MAGSVKDKCVKCKKAIKSTEIVLVCGLWCKKSFHNQCLGLSNSEVRAVTCSKVRIKFHCEACENRLATELVGVKETQESNNLDNCVSLLELVQKLVKLTKELSNDNSTINSKLDTVLISNARLEEYLLRSPERLEKRNEETPEKRVGCEGSNSTERINEIREQNNNTNSQDQVINNERMCRESEVQQTEDNLQCIASDFVADGQQQNCTESCSSISQQEWEMPEGHDSTHDPLNIDEEDCEEPDGDDGIQDALSIVKEECPPSEDFFTSGTFSTEKTGNAEEEERAAVGDDGEECPPSEYFVMSGTCSIQKQENAEYEETAVMEDNGEECTSSEDLLRPNTLSTETVGNKEDEETMNDDNFEELQHEMQSTISGGEAERSFHVGVEYDKINDDSTSSITTVSQAPRTGHKIQRITKQEALCVSKIGARNLGKESKICKNAFAQMQKPKKQTHRCSRGLLYSCSTCHKMFSDSYKLKRHFLVHTHERSYSCSTCSKTFADSRTLKNHSRLHTGERPYICNTCNKTFNQIGNLKKHYRLHTGERPYICSTCSKTFNDCSNLKSHTRLHTGERPYICNTCNKTFNQITHLKIHNRLHTGERPYICQVCNKSFTSSSNLNTHFRLHTGKRPYGSAECHKSFTCESSLRSHSKVHTGERPFRHSTIRHSKKVGN